ncbi:MAG: (d)CMP kinase [Clostridiales bacterium]|jgi:cytidylate kinase|nr:(d)CMP kinase [Clostridiales bacterium]
MINIAIDGPSGAGKSTVAKAIARKIGFIYVDTGALYRAVGINALRLGYDTSDREKVVSTLDSVKIDLRYINGEQRVLLNGEDVSDAIRLPEASMAASNVSAIPEVRAFLFDLQRQLAAQNNCIMDGRDIGTVVLPNADIKLFLTASPEERAARRHRELIERGTPVDYDVLLEEIKQRDYNDSHRAIAPLKPADDAIIVDTSGNTLQESVDNVLEIIKSKIDIPNV